MQPKIAPEFADNPRYKKGDLALYFKNRKDAETWINENELGCIGWSSPQPICVCTLSANGFLSELQNTTRGNYGRSEVSLVVIPQS